MKSMSKMPPAKRIFLMSLDDLVKTKSIDKIKTRDIYEMAGLSANTFYYHFKDKYECATLLVEYYETLLHDDYQGDIGDFYEYISSGKYIESLYSDKILDSKDNGLQILRECYEREFEKLPEALKFWQKHGYIINNILNSKAQNSPREDLYKAWEGSFTRILDCVPVLTKASKEYIAHIFCETFFTFWFSSISNPTIEDYEVTQVSKIFEKTFFSLYNIVSETAQNNE